MDVLHHLAQAAAVLLLIYLLVVLIIFLAVAGGLAFGLRWSRGKSGWAFEKANGYLPMVTKYVHQGTDYAAKPFILGGGLAERIAVTVEAVQRRVRETRAQRAAAPPPAVASRPADVEVTVVVPAVSEETVVVPAVPEVRRGT